MPDKEKRGNLRYVVTYNAILTNQKTESFEYHWLRALVMFDVTSFPPFCRASDVISSSVDTLIIDLCDLGLCVNVVAGGIVSRTSEKALAMVVIDCFLSCL